MAKSTIWTLVVILLLSYAFVPPLNTYINNLIGVRDILLNNPDDITKESSEESIRCSDDTLSESQFLIYILIFFITLITGIYAGYQYHKKHIKAKKNGRPTKGINKD